MVVYQVFKTDDYDSYSVGLFATKELAEDYCTLMGSTEEAEYSSWWYTENEVITEPFWPKILPNQIDFNKKGRKNNA